MIGSKRVFLVGDIVQVILNEMYFRGWGIHSGQSYRITNLYATDPYTVWLNMAVLQCTDTGKMIELGMPTAALMLVHREGMQGDDAQGLPGRRP